jgi:hypothetical protein
MSADEPPSSKLPTAPSRRLAKTVGTIAVLGLMGASYALGRVTIGDEPNAAYFIHPGIICEQVVRIIWSADASGKLTFIGGDYKSHCI